MCSKQGVQKQASAGIECFREPASFVGAPALFLFRTRLGQPSAGNVPYRTKIFLRKEAEMSVVWLRRGFEFVALMAALLFVTSLVEA